jgi:ADP-heptose:LPS heptosyltransferase
LPKPIPIVQKSFLKKLDAVAHPAASLLASLMPKPEAPSTGETLIIRPGGLGDLVCADIALEELGQDARAFTWLIETRSQPWAKFRELPHFCYDGNGLAIPGEVQNRFSTVINTEQFFGLAESCALLCRAKKGRVISFDTNRGSNRSDETVAYDWENAHETIEFARLFAAALKLPYEVPPRGPRPRKERDSAPPLILISGRQSRSRQLTVEEWAALVARWHRGRSFLIAGAPDDTGFVVQLARRFEGLGAPFAGSFAETCKQIARSEEIFTMDGGPVHIASYFGVSTLAMFTSGRDRKWHPLGDGSRMLRRHDLPCQPCTKFGQVPPCPISHACLKLDDGGSDPIG